MAPVTTLTSKGRVTIPKEIRDELGLKPHDKIRFSLENGHAVLRKAYPSLEKVAGSVPARRPWQTPERPSPVTSRGCSRQAKRCRGKFRR